MTKNTGIFLQQHFASLFLVEAKFMFYYNIDSSKHYLCQIYIVHHLLKFCDLLTVVSLRFPRYAVTEESTPPLMATRTFFMFPISASH